LVFVEIIDESSPKALDLESTSLAPYIEETMEVQLHNQIDKAMEIQV